MQKDPTNKTKSRALPGAETRGNSGSQLSTFSFQLFRLLTFLGTSLLRAIDAVWAGVAFITTLGRRGESREPANIAKQQPLAGFPNFTPARLAEDERMPYNA
jgi:hypothetical protein